MVRKGKPAPDLFLHAAAQMGADPARCLVIEDSLTGIRAGEALKDAKSRLQEFLQGRKLALPTYELVSVTGEAHEQHFQVRCLLAASAVTAHQDIVTEGAGVTRRVAEQQAAAAALAVLELGAGQKHGIR